MKRGSKSDDSRPPKKRRLNEAHLNEDRLFADDDMDWLECELGTVKDRIMQMAGHIRAEVDTKLDDILYEVRQLSQI